MSYRGSTDSSMLADFTFPSMPMMILTVPLSSCTGAPGCGAYDGTVWRIVTAGVTVAARVLGAAGGGVTEGVADGNDSLTTGAETAVRVTDFEGTGAGGGVFLTMSRYPELSTWMSLRSATSFTAGSRMSVRTF